MIDRWILPEWAEDRLHTDVDVHFDWADRLRLLVTGRCSVKVEVTVEHKPGRMESASRVNVNPIRWPWRKRLEMATAEAPR